MNPTNSFLVSLLLTLSSTCILDAVPPHPNLFLNAGELGQLRLKLKTEPWRARLFELVRQDADRGNLVAAPVVYALAQDAAYGSKIRAQLLQQANGFVPGRTGAQYPWGPEAGSAIAFDLVAPLLSAGECQAVTYFLR